MAPTLLHGSKATAEMCVLKAKAAYCLITRRVWKWGGKTRFLLNIHGQIGGFIELPEVGFFNPSVKLLRSKVLLMSALLSEQPETGKCVEHQSRRFFFVNLSKLLPLDAFFCCFFPSGCFVRMIKPGKNMQLASEVMSWCCECVRLQTRFHFKVPHKEAAESVLWAKEAAAHSLFIKSRALL